MKMRPETFAALQARLQPLDTPEIRAAYRRGDFPRADKVRNLDTRYRWDLYWHARGFECFGEDEVLNQAHIETALRRIVPALLTY